MSTISIALTTYNGEKYLREQLDSLLTQTIPFDELIICDDNSCDGTRDILNEYAIKEKRIKLFLNKKNIGFKANFENVLKLCKGDYIALCDQDDIWLPYHLEVLTGSIKGKLLICGNANLIDGQSNLLRGNLSDIKNFHKAENDNKSIFKFIVYYQNPFQGASMLMHRNFLNYALPIPQSVKYHDVWFAHLACLLDSFIYTYEPVTLYRMHGANTSGDHRHTAQFRTVLGHLIKDGSSSNRKEVVYALSKLKVKYKSDFKYLLDEAISYYNNRLNFFSRIKSLVFELKNFKSIYGHDKK